MAENNSNEITISYETLFEILRREKNRDDIQKLSDNFFIDVRSYLEDKKSELKKSDQKVDLFSTTEKSKLKNQIDNVIRILIDIYNRREKKIISMAINKARTQSNIIDTKNLLTEEKELFLDISKNLHFFRDTLMRSMIEGKDIDLMKGRPQSGKHSIESTPKQGSGASESKNINSLGVSNDVQTGNNEIKPEDDNLRDETKTIRFINPVPKFVGKELEVYGPFEEEDIANLPSDIAELLIRKGRAEEIKSS